jgi:predicted transcriptional regulator
MDGAMNEMRLQRAEAVRDLRAEGLTHREIADRLGISRSYAAELDTDPDGTKVRDRKRAYGAICQDCGAATYGGDGRFAAPRLCLKCTKIRKAAQHGTRSKYNTGCRCEPCAEANRAAHWLYRNQPHEIPSHGNSGYVNHGCRCEVCKRANAAYQREQRERRRARQAA